MGAFFRSQACTLWTFSIFGSVWKPPTVLETLQVTTPELKFEIPTPDGKKVFGVEDVDQHLGF